MAQFGVQKTNEAIERLKRIFNVKFDTGLSKALGLHQSTLSSWRLRGTLDLKLIYDRIENVSLDYIVYGVGSEFIETEYNDLEKALQETKDKTKILTDIDNKTYVEVTIEVKKKV